MNKLLTTAALACGLAVTSVQANDDRGLFFSFENKIRPGSIELYESFIPNIPGVSAAETPTITYNAIRTFGDFYLEGQILINVDYNGKEHTWAIDQPLNNWIGYLTGFAFGFNKTLEHMCIKDNGSRLEFFTGVEDPDTCADPRQKATLFTFRRSVEDTPPQLPIPLPEGTVTPGGLLTINSDGCLINNYGGAQYPEDAKVDFRAGLVYYKSSDDIPYDGLLPTGYYGGGAGEVTIAGVANQNEILACGFDRRAIYYNPQVLFR